jgi:PAS domain S-box-containing protein
VPQTRESNLNLAPARKMLGMTFARNAYPMWIYDRETLSFLDVNMAAIRNYGYSRQQFLTMTILDIRPTEDISKVRHQTSDPRLESIRSTAEKWTHQAKDGTVFPVSITSWELTYRERPAKLVLARKDSASDSERTCEDSPGSPITKCRGDEQPR